MIRISKPIRALGVHMVGLVECSVDQSAERCVILDRNTLVVYANTFVTDVGVIKRIVPKTYALNNDLIVGILDDDGMYNAAFADGVKAQLVDANTVNMSQ